MKKIIKSLFRKIFPAPTEEQLLEKGFKLLYSLKKAESKINDYKRHIQYSKDVGHCEDLIEIIKSTPHGKRKSLLNLTIAFIRLQKSIYSRT